jgi:Arc/MetJ-type ribon-helix-helix transcriptional regulator
MLASSKLIEKYSSFSELVSSSLELLLEKNKKEEYKKAMIEASKDKLYLQDMEDVANDFQYVDFEEK